MGKRIGGVLALLIGLGITVFCAVRLAYRIPSNFTADGEGLDFLINIAVKYELRGYIVHMIPGIGIGLWGLCLLVSPRKHRVAIARPVSAEEASSAETAAPSAKVDRGRVETPTCILCTDLTGATFRGKDGKTGRALLADAAPGDFLLCRMVTDHQFSPSIGVFTLRGVLLGYLDAAFVRELCTRYPDHRISVTVDRITADPDVAFRCRLRVGVYAAE